MRDALSLADQVLAMGDGAVEPQRVREALGLVAEDEFIALLDLIADHRAGDVFGFVARLADAGIDFGQFLTGFADMLRAQLAVTLGGTPPEVSERAREALESRRNAFAPGDLLRMLSVASELEPRFRKSAQQQLLLEAMLVRFALLDRTVSLEEMLRGLGGGGSGGGGGSDRGGNDRGGGAEPPGGGRTSPPSAPSSRRADSAVDSAAGDWRAVIRDADRAPTASARAAAPAVVEQRAPAAPAAPARAPSPPPRPASNTPIANEAMAAPPDLNQVVERWDDLIAGLRAAGKSVAATALGHASPATVNARGDVTIALDEANPIYEQAIESTKTDVANTLRGWFPGVQRVLVRAPESPAAPPARLTDAMVRAERIATLRKQDPVLDAAIDALDLDLAD
jgi:DNA polymerase-3 subunit gamma/tau